MKRQMLKTFNGYAVTYDGKRKCNRFVVTLHGKVVEHYGDFYSCLCYITNVIPNFERL